MGRVVAIGKKSPVPPKRRPKHGILVADHRGPPFSTLGAFLCLFRFLKPFSRNGRQGDPSENIRDDGKFRHNIIFLFSVGPKGGGRFAAELKMET